MDGTKNSDIRINNRKRLINLLFRHGAMTKQEISDRLDISLPTATLLLKELNAKGLIQKGETLGSTGGRKPVELAPVYDARYAVGMEVSNHEIRFVLMDLGLHLLAKTAYPFGIRYEREYWEHVNVLLQQFIDDNVKDRSKLLDVGLTLQLPMNKYGLIWKKNVPEADRFRLESIEACFDGHINIRNSAKMAALAQVYNGREDQNFVFLTVGSFIGGAIIVNREVLDFAGLNGQFGAMFSGGRHVHEFLAADCLMEKCGVEHLDEVFIKIRKGDEVCVKVWEEYLDILCRLIYNLRQFMGWKVVIGGALSPYLEKYLPDMYRRLETMEEYFTPDESYMQISDLGEFGASLGAGMISVQRYLSEGFNEEQ